MSVYNQNDTKTLIFSVFDGLSDIRIQEYAWVNWGRRAQQRIVA